jgi:hypothetical protein
VIKLQHLLADLIKIARAQQWTAQKRGLVLDACVSVFPMMLGIAHAHALCAEKKMQMNFGSESPLFYSTHKAHPLGAAPQVWPAAVAAACYYTIGGGGSLTCSDVTSARSLVGLAGV